MGEGSLTPLPNIFTRAHNKEFGVYVDLAHDIGRRDSTLHFWYGLCISRYIRSTKPDKG